MPGRESGWVFGLVSVALAPASIAGYLLWVGGIALRARASRVSSTAQGPLFARYLQHELGARPDEAAQRLMRALPDVPKAALFLSTAPLLVAHRLSHYVPEAFRYPYPGKPKLQYEAAARATYFDAALERRLPQIAQLVILGAGFDTRCYDPRFTAKRTLALFEVDQPDTQARKQELLARAAVDASRVRFVSADFQREKWLTRLCDAGFDPTQPALFIWEGVTMYLDRAAIEATLRDIAGLASASAIAFDYFSTQVLESDALYMRYARFATKLAGEPLRFGVDSRPPVATRVRELLGNAGLNLAEHDEWGEEHVWGGFAVGQVQ